MTSLLEVAESAARAGGAILLEWRDRFETREKSPADLVTDADVASERQIRATVAEHFPDHQFVGEEGDDKTPRLTDNQVCWIVDPLDGTTNYVHGFPFFAVSIGAVRDGQLLAGVIYDPLRDKCYRAAVGEGAWCNDRPLRVSDVPSIDQALVALSLPPRVEPDSPDLAGFVSVVQVCQAIRRSGSCALNLAHVAAGELDAVWATEIHPWDVAAGVLLVREAGGRVTGSDGGEFDLWNPHFVATAGDPLHQQLVGRLRSATR